MPAPRARAIPRPTHSRSYKENHRRAERPAAGGVLDGVTAAHAWPPLSNIATAEPLVIAARAAAPCAPRRHGSRSRCARRASRWRVRRRAQLELEVLDLAHGEAAVVHAPPGPSCPAAPAGDGRAAAGGRGTHLAVRRVGRRSRRARAPRRRNRAAAARARAAARSRVAAASSASCRAFDAATSRRALALQLRHLLVERRMKSGSSSSPAGRLAKSTATAPPFSARRATQAWRDFWHGRLRGLPSAVATSLCFGKYGAAGGARIDWSKWPRRARRARRPAAAWRERAAGSAAVERRCRRPSNGRCVRSVTRSAGRRDPRASHL